MKVPDTYLRLLREEGISLAGSGVNDTGLPPRSAAKAIQILKDSGIALIGGEAWQKVGERFVPIYDIWNIERGDFPDLQDYLRESWRLAESHVARHEKRDDIFLVLGT